MLRIVSKFRTSEFSTKRSDDAGAITPSRSADEIIAVARKDFESGPFGAHFDGVIILRAIGAHGNVAERVLVARLFGHLGIGARKRGLIANKIRVAASGARITRKRTGAASQKRGVCTDGIDRHI